MSIVILNLILKYTIAVVIFVFVVITSRKNGILTRDKQTLSGKLNSSKNLSAVIAKELEKNDPKYKTLFYKVSRAYTTDDFNNLVHEIYETVSPIDYPTGTEIQELTEQSFLPPKSRPKK